MFAKGDRVRHPSKPEWGIGQILETSGEANVRVFFVDIGEKTLNAGIANLTKVSGAEATHPVLDNLRLNKSGHVERFKTFDLARADFLKQFPEGFEDNKYLEAERNYKYEAHELMMTLLNEQEISALINAGNYAEICKRALQIVNKTNLIFPNEKMALKDGLATDSSKKRFAETLFALLYGKDDIEKWFSAFAECLLAIGAAKWTIVTYFLYLRYPADHMFMKPTITQVAADLCAFELNYHPDPNWLTYKSLQTFSRHLFDRLSSSNLVPRDMIDVQSFMWCIDEKNRA
jgi:hypothetical protein